MSHINDLIQGLCPEGVSFQPLGTLGRRNKGTAMTAARMREIDSGGPIRVFAGGNTVADVDETSVPVKAVVRQPSIIVKSRGHIGFTYYEGPFSHKSELWSYTLSDPVVNQKFVYYYLLTRTRDLQDLARATSVKLPQLSVRDTDALKVPVPPLEVQEEIVRILDTFSALTAELEAELEARRTQYEHYRDVLLSGTRSEADWPVVQLKDVADLLVGYAFKSKEFTSALSGVRLLRGDNIGQGRLKHQDFKRWSRFIDDGLDRYELAEGDVVLAMDRPWIPAGLKWAIVGPESLPALLVQRVARLRGHPGVLHQGYLAGVIGSTSFTRHVLNVQTGNTVPHISGATIGKFRFSLPPVQEQVRLAAQVDKFDALVNDISIGLPAEIEARRMQYEYYRDRLLTFEEAPA